MTRLRVELIARRQLDHLPEVHDGDPVTHVADYRKVMGDEDQGQPHLALETAQQVEHLRLDRHVEGRHRLVGDQKLWLQRDRAGDTDPLTLTTRELMRITVVVLGVEADAIH